MFKKGDRVKEGNQIGVVTDIHTPGTVDVLFDGEEYAIRRQDYDVTLLKGNPMRIIRNKAHLRLVKPKKKSKRVKKLTQSMRDKLPKSDFIFPKRRSFPIPDIGHGRLALQYGQFPNNRKDLEKIKKAVFKRYPSLIKWWNSHHPEDRWTQRKQKRKMVANPILTKNQMKEFLNWIDDGNAYETKDGIWLEQTTQYRKKFTYDQLQRFFKREYLTENNPSKKRWKLKKSKQNGQIVYIVTGRVRRGPKVFYTLKNAQDFMDRRKRD